MNRGMQLINVMRKELKKGYVDKSEQSCMHIFMPRETNLRIISIVVLALNWMGGVGRKRFS